jgi:hypothetical protein
MIKSSALNVGECIDNDVYYIGDCFLIDKSE